MRLLLTLTSGLSLLLATPPPSTKKTTTALRKKAPPISTGKAPVRAKAGTRKPFVTQAPRQAGPTPDRYRQIQESLAAKGYLQGAPSGVWDQNSVDAMKKFQADQKLEPTGKITSRALIDLGLGPTQESAPPTSK